MLRPSPARKKAVLCLFVGLFFVAIFGTKPVVSQDLAPIKIKWAARSGVERYRLQVATDPDFGDIVFDRAVSGNEFTVQVLPKGRYFWRVAPAAGETGNFSIPVAVDSAAVPLPSPSPTPVPLLLSSKSEWRVVTKSPLKPVLASVDLHGSVILLAVDDRGFVYAFDGLTGEARWTLSTAGTERSSVAPVLVGDQNQTAVVIANGKRLRAVKPLSGDLLWEKTLSTTVSDIYAPPIVESKSQEFLVISEGGSALTVIDATKGDVNAEIHLNAPIVGRPAILKTNRGDGYVLAERGGNIEFINRKGEIIDRSRLGDEPISGPLVAVSSRGGTMVVATVSAVIGFDVRNLASVWRTEIGRLDRLSSVGLTGSETNDNAQIIVSNRTNVSAIDTISGKVRWTMKAANQGYSLGFADVDFDGNQDIILGYDDGTTRIVSGRDGVVLYESAGKTAAAQATLRATREHVVAAPAPAGSGAWVFVSDGTGPGLKASLISRINAPVAVR